MYFVCPVGGVAIAMVGMWSVEDNLQEFVPSFYHVGSRDWSQVSRLGNKIVKAATHWDISLDPAIYSKFILTLECF